MTLLLPVATQNIRAQLPDATPPPSAAVDPGAVSLPVFSVPSLPAGLSIQGGASGVQVEAAFRGSRFAIASEYSRLNGFTLDTRVAAALGPRAAIGLLVTSGAARKEWLVNTGWRLSPANRLFASAGQSFHSYDMAFASGTNAVLLHQNTAAASYQMAPGRGVLQSLGVDAYFARAPSLEIEPRTVIRDTPDRYELYVERRRIAGSDVRGLAARVELTPWPQGALRLNVGAERLAYDFLTAPEVSTTRTEGLRIDQRAGVFNLFVATDRFASQRIHSAGAGSRLFGGAHHANLTFTAIDGRNGLPDDVRWGLAYVVAFGGHASPVATEKARASRSSERGGGSADLLAQVFARPTFVPAQVVARIDPTSGLRGVVIIEKSGLPGGASIDHATGDVIVPVPTAGIVATTRDGLPFTNTGQFSFGPQGLVIRPSQMEEPWAGATSTYVVTTEEAPGIRRDVTVLVASSPLRIVSVTVSEATDALPDDFAFAHQGGVSPSTSVVSNAITVAGIDVPTSISVTGGEYAIGDTGYTTAAGTVSLGQTVRVRHLSAATPGVTTTTTLTIGGVTATFTSRTVPPDTTPDAFSFTARTGVALRTLVRSNAVTTSGINTLTAISVRGGEYVIDDGDYTSAAGTIGIGRTVRVRHTSAATPGTATATTLTIGGVTAAFITTTIDPDTAPDAFGFTSRTGVAPGTLVTSNAVTIEGLETPSAIAVSGGEYAIDDGSFTSSAGTVGNGQSVRVRHTSAATPVTATTTTLTISGVTGTFTSTTAGLSTTPDAISFTALTGVSRGAVVTSNLVTISGIDSATSIAVSGGEYAIDGGTYTSTAGTISAGQTVRVRHTAAATPGTSTTTTLTVDGITGVFTSTTVGPDTTPSAFSFPAQTGVALGAVVTSTAVTISGIDSVTAVSVSGGEYSIDGGTYTTAPGTISNGQSVSVRHTAAAAPGTATTTTLIVGDVAGTFASTTIWSTPGPHPFGFTPQTGVALNALVVSNTITVVGTSASSPISVSGGEYALDGGPYTSEDGVIGPGQSVSVRHTAAATPGTATTTTLIVEGMPGTFTSTTVGPDTMPDAFSFTAQAGVTPSTVVTSNAVTITGINTATAVSVSSGGEYAIDGGTYTAAAGTISAGQTVRVRHTAAAAPTTTTTTTLTVGGVAGTFTSTTIGPDTTPDAFSFTPQTGVDLSTRILSNIVVIAGFDTDTSVSVTGGGGSEYRIGNGPWRSSAGTLSPGDTVRVRHTSAATPGTATTTTLTIGGVIGTFTTTTLVPDTTPNAFSFTAQTGVDSTTLVTSNTVTISGITGDTAISVSGAAGSEYRVGTGTWTSAPGTIANGQTVRVRHITAATPGTATTTTLTIGGVTGTFTATTFNPDTTPDAFTFAAQTGVATGTVVTSDRVTVSGFNTDTAISISGTAGSEYQIGSGAWRSAPSTIREGQTVRVRHTSASDFGTTTTTTLTIGGVSGTFSVTTALRDVCSDPIAFTSHTGVKTNVTVTSNPVTVSGINAPTAIWVGGAPSSEYRIGNGAWTSEPGTVEDGDSVRVRHISSSSPNTAVTTILTVGIGASCAVSASFSSTTR